ncbi:unannotated protein [freshwater metagenome]|uniref:Unannotated protein n=1 Tax=freshwater metagenome TaxID=449393 RepID=A0A6J7JXP1_9ZZZZ|nr:GNAT family N-acetyltransferase [Actinomycetota bacterium]
MSAVGGPLQGDGGRTAVDGPSDHGAPAVDGSRHGAAALVAGPLRGRVVDARSDEAARAWATLSALRGGLPVMRDRAWTDAWARTYGDVTRPAYVLVEDAAGTLQGGALIASSRRWFGPVPIRTLWIGTANTPRGQEVCSEFSPVLAHPGREAEVVRAVRATARRARRWDQIRIDGVPEDDVAAHVAGWPAERVRRRADPAPRFRLDRLAPGAEVATGLSGGPRRRARTSLRALAAAGRVETEWATSPDDVGDVLEDLMRLHQARWTRDGHPGLFGDGRFAAMHRGLLPTLAAQGRAVLFRLRLDGETVGCLYLLVDGDRLAFYQSGFADLGDNRLRPGLVTHLHCMAEARDRGYAVYDFLAGDARYKRELSDERLTTTRIELRRPRVRLALFDVAHRGREWVRVAREAARRGDA